MFTLLHGINIFVSSLIIFIRLLREFKNNNDNLTDQNWDYKLVISLIVFIYAGIVILLIGFGLLHQTYLITNNITTNECLRSRLPEDTFDKGCYNNWKEVCDDYQVSESSEIYSIRDRENVNVRL